MSEPEPLVGRVAIVTGASRGIGRAVASRLAELGADLGLMQRGDAADTVAEIAATGRRAIVRRVDLSEATVAEEVTGSLIAELGGVDVLVCNAGVIHREASLSVPLATWQKVIDTNLTSTFAVARAAASDMVERGTHGRIVLVSSVLAFQGGLNVSAYAASKAGVGNLARALANEWAAFGINVNAVAPGYVENEQTAALRADPLRKGQIDERIPAGAWCTVEAIADAVTYLVLPGSEYVHGHTLVVDGGWLGR